MTNKDILKQFDTIDYENDYSIYDYADDFSYLNDNDILEYDNYENKRNDI